MPRVRLFCDWDDDSHSLLWRRLIHQMSNPIIKDRFGGYHLEDAGDYPQLGYKDIVFVTGENYDHAVVFNFPTQEYNTPPEKNFALLLEPPEIYDGLPQYAGWREQKNIGVGQIYSFCEDTPYESATGIGFATAPAEGNYPPNEGRPYKVCMIVSNKIITPYHAKRHEIKEALLASNLDIHFYGRGLSGSDSRIRGEIGPMAKHTVLPDYQFCIDFENADHGVVTDKFFDPVFCNTIPISNSFEPYRKTYERCLYPMVSFYDSVDKIVKDIEDVVFNWGAKQWSPGLPQIREEILTGSLSLVEWIYQRVMERT